MLSPKSGIIFVKLAPSPSLSLSSLHDWYNNEHGPLRVRQPFIQNGFRYRAADMSSSGKGKPEWLAIYDVSDMSKLTSPEFLKITSPDVSSQREKDTMRQLVGDKRFFDFVSERKVKDFQSLEDLGRGKDPNMELTGKGRVMVAVSISLQDKSLEKEVAFEKWYEEEHIPMLSVVPGWLRTRRFVTSTIGGEDGEDKEYLALHEYAAKNGLDGPEFVAATTTSWNKEIKRDVVQEKRRRVYEHVYTFGPAPRDLKSVPSNHPFESNDGILKTISSEVAIESYITTKDGIRLLYRLEGSVDENAPVIVLSNSILVNFHIWDGFLKHFSTNPANSKFRFLRYDTRGRTSEAGSNCTIGRLSSDIIDLLDALRVRKAAAIIGVSLGGITVLNTALKHPERVEAFVSCDTSATSPAGNAKTWGERIVVAEKEGATAVATSGKEERIVGEQLAEMTAKRWFVEESWKDAEIAPVCKKVQAMVAANSLSGFKQCVQALYQYDVSAEMAQGKPIGMFVVGSKDGVLPGVMEKMAKSYAGGKAVYATVPGAGHLPMVEKPKEFAEAVSKFLARRNSSRL